MHNQKAASVVVIGAGPAGLTAAYELSKAGIKSTILEKESQVGGLSKTVNHEGYHFDIGGHRFFTKIKAVEDLWRELLTPDEFPRRQRLSRIFYNKKFIHYPLRAVSALQSLGAWNSVRVLGSYLRARLRPHKPEVTLEHWVSNRFGSRLYEIFFKSYTEKVWGIPCSEISAEWAAQRIKGLDLLTAVRRIFSQPQTTDGAVIRTLIHEFRYPRRGPGMMWERAAEIIKQHGGEIHTNAGAGKIHWRPGAVTAVEIEQAGASSPGVKHPVTHLISSMPLRELVECFEPKAPREVRAAAQRLNYRDFLTVALIVNRAHIFPDNWIYIHDPEVKVGRIQNFKNWSADMVPDPDKTCLGLEYFCFAGDSLWSMADDELIALGTREIESIGLVEHSEVEGGKVVRMPKAYPVYDSGYKEALKIVQDFLSTITNLHCVGRNGMHKYNNQDHSMMTAMLAVRNILGANHDLWAVNADEEYHETIARSNDAVSYEIAALNSTQPAVPERISVAPSL